MHPVIIIGSLFLMAVAAVWLLIQNSNRYLIYSVALALTCAVLPGAVFEILHLQGADQLMLTGLAGTVLCAGLLIGRSFHNAKKEILFYKLIAGLILLFQIVSAPLWPEQADRTALLNYPLTAFIGTLLINQQYEHRGERNMLIFLMLQGFLYILIEVSKLF
jgi:hypothetical protein